MNNLILAQYQSSKWAAEPMFLESFIRRISELKVTESIAAIDVAVKPRSYSVVGGRAVINISGVLLKTVPGWLRFWGIEATGYDEIQAQVGQALADSSIQGIHLQVSSPGGMVDGLVDTADAIFDARSSIKVTATVEDLGASAAYWLTSQAETIEANRTTEVGSIGVYTVYLDSTKRAEALGFKVVLIKSGEHKGMGYPGVEITDEQIAAVQSNIDAIAEQFVNSVARGRSMDAGDIGKLATGRLWIAAEAKKLGLIDRVTKAAQSSSSNTVQSKGENQMDQNTNETAQAALDKKAAEQDIKAAKLAEREHLVKLQEAFPDDLAFAVGAFNKGLSVEQAKADYCDVLREKLKTQAAARGTQSVQAEGAEAIGTGDTDDAGSGDFLAEARELAETKKISVTAAMKKLARTRPDLHRAFLSRCATSGQAMYAESA